MNTFSDMNTADEPLLGRRNFRRSVPVLTVIAILFVLVLGGFLASPPQNFPAGQMISIEKGMTLAQVSDYLKEHSVIRSTLIFEATMIVRSGDKGVLAGDYYFNDPLSVFSVASRLARAVYGLDPVRVTIPEGSTVNEMAQILKKQLADFDPVEFLSLAKDMEGYLFPDTYFFLPNETAPQVIKEMRDTFEKRVAEIQPAIDVSGHSLKEIVTMASLLEKEGVTFEDKRIISGILWKRIEIGMPLQVDAVFPYINGKNTYQLTLEDLKIDSPYNTYLYKGLPPGPIANPGLDSLKAAASPTASPYLFYLSDRHGEFYYARNFEEHKKNKQLYLN